MNFRYSIIVPHYDGSISDETFERGIKCLLDQTEQNFEVLLYHDGPVSRPIPEVYKQFGDRCRLMITETRENNWGHSNRDRGIKSAKGDYIVHFNPDNILYPYCLQQISSVIDNHTYPFNKNYGQNCLISNNIIIFAIYMNGHFRFGSPKFKAFRFKKSQSSHRSIFTGDPCVLGNIDCLQLVMKRNLWLTYGGWYNKDDISDGLMYQRFVNDHGARYCSEILGEHD